MKLLSVGIPSYNSQDYLEHCVESLVPGGDKVEILIIDDGSKDNTAQIADALEAKYPGIVRAIHQENGGHGEAVNAGLRNATGLFYKVVDSDDWVGAEAYQTILSKLEQFAATGDMPDMIISNFIYDKQGVTHKKVMEYRKYLPVDRMFTWEDAKKMPTGTYILMHSVIYRTEMLKASGMVLPKHTFYVDNIFVFYPLPFVKKLYYIDADFYHYFIGREDQSVQEQVMIRRIDQALLVNRLLVSSVDPYAIPDKHKRKYMLNYLEIVTTVSSVLLTKSGTEENLQKKKDLWAFIQKENPQVYDTLRHRLLGRLIHLPGKRIVLAGYSLAQKIYGFN